ncbi:MAG: ABC transporter ATP-binding protein [Gammaproteobacteria bacterium]
MSLAAREATCVRDGAQVLQTVSCAVRRGALLAICGPNGAGKSTLLRALAGLQPLVEGQITLRGQPLTDLAPRQRARAVGYLAQAPEIAWPLAVRDLAALGRVPRAGEPREVTAAAIDAALSTLGLNALARRNAQSLSGGELTRAHLARLLAGGHDFLLADEPTTALDPGHQLEVLGTLARLARTGLGIAVVLHDLPLAARFCDEVLVLAQGRVVTQGPPRDVLSPALLTELFRIRGVWDPDGTLAGFAPLAPGEA